MSQEVRLAVQRALDKLVNRFGSQSEVIGELRNALALMDKSGSGDAGTSALPAVEVPAEPVETVATEAEVTPEPDTGTGEPKAQPAPKARKSTGRKK